MQQVTSLSWVRTHKSKKIKQTMPYGDFLKWRYPKIINLYRNVGMIHYYKPSILGYHHLWKPPNTCSKKLITPRYPPVQSCPEFRIVPFHNCPGICSRWPSKTKKKLKIPQMVDLPIENQKSPTQQITIEIPTSLRQLNQHVLQDKSHPIKSF